MIVIATINPDLTCKPMVSEIDHLPAPQLKDADQE
jgi:hypothetical protein